MPFIVTLVAATAPLTNRHIGLIKDIIGQDRSTVDTAIQWLAPGKAVDITLTQRPNHDCIRSMRKLLSDEHIDVFVTTSKSRRKKLLIADMDSTIIEGETLDEIAAHAGLKETIAPITERAMRGELDFAQALHERVALLKGLSSELLDTVLQATAPNPGASTLIRTMKHHDAYCVLASGGFTFFTSAFAAQIGFDDHHGNDLEITAGKITGTVREPILDKDSKTSLLKKHQKALALQDDTTMAIGDGANDLPMLQTAAFGIGYHPKPLLRDALDNCILYGDLTTALFAQGYHIDEWQN